MSNMFRKSKFVQRFLYISYRHPELFFVHIQPLTFSGLFYKVTQDDEEILLQYLQRYCELSKIIKNEIK